MNVRGDDVNLRGRTHDGVAVERRHQHVLANLRPANASGETGAILGEPQRDVSADAARRKQPEAHRFLTGNLPGGDVVIQRLDVHSRLGSRAGRGR